jgi:hypothetical protein
MTEKKSVMRHLSLAALLMFAVTTQSQAETRTLARHGFWNAFGGTTNSGRATCGVDSTGEGGRHLMVQYYGRATVLRVRVIRSSWNIPEGSEVPVRMAVDGLSWTAMAYGSGREISFTLVGDTISQFERAFRAGTMLRLTFPNGSEGPWNFSLIGTNAVVTAFLDCLRVIRGETTQPHGGPTQPHGSPPARPLTPSQPHAGRAI